MVSRLGASESGKHLRRVWSAHLHPILPLLHSTLILPHTAFGKTFDAFPSSNHQEKNQRLSVKQCVADMAPAKPAPAYAKDEKVLCFHGPLLYDAKITELRRIDPRDAKMGWEYKVHYKGWKNT
jgi:hypothetical protein